MVTGLRRAVEAAHNTDQDRGVAQSWLVKRRVPSVYAGQGGAGCIASGAAESVEWLVMLGNVR